MGFDHFYGFVGGDTSQWQPNLYRNTTAIYPFQGNPSWNLETAMNLLNLKRTIWSGPALGAGKHTIVFDFKSDSPDLGKGGTGVLSVDGKEVDRKSMEHTTPVTFAEESFDVGQDTETGVAMLQYRYDVPFKFTGKINKLTFKLEPPPKATSESKAELGPMAAPEPDPIEPPEH
jgi:hypothetical protein